MGADAFGEGAGLMNEGLPNLYLTKGEQSSPVFDEFRSPSRSRTSLRLDPVGKSVLGRVKDLEHPGIVIEFLWLCCRIWPTFLSTWE